MPVFLLTPPASKSKTSAPIAQNHYSSPQIISVKSPAISATRYTKKQGQQQGESVAGDYFMAAHTLKWPVIGLALFATNISCVHLVSLAQSGYDTGLLNGNFEWMAAQLFFCKSS